MTIPETFTCIATRRHTSGLWLETFNAPITCEAARKLLDEGIITMAQRRHETFTELLIKSKAAKR